MTSETEMFKLFMKDKSIPKKEKTKMLRTYAKSLGMKGAGKKSGKVLIHDIAQAGGSWGSFVNFFKKTGRAIGNAGKFVYNKAIKPAVNAIAEKPLSTIGKAAGLAGMIPGPWSAPLKTAGTALTAVGSAVGKGQAGGASKPLMIFN